MVALKCLFHADVATVNDGCVRHLLIIECFNIPFGTFVALCVVKNPLIAWFIN